VNSGGGDLQAVALLAGWPTPMAGSPGTEDYNPAGNTDSSRKTVALLAGWATPTAQDHSRGNKPPRPHDTGIPLSQQVTAVPGPTSTLFNAETGKPGESRGRLNPAFSCWLMGYPAIWAAIGSKAIRSRKKRSKAV